MLSYDTKRDISQIQWLRTASESESDILIVSFSFHSQILVYNVTNPNNCKATYLFVGRDSSGGYTSLMLLHGKV